MKLRVSHVLVQPILTWDDGEELSPGPQAQPVQVPLSALSGLADRVRKEIAEQEAQLLQGPAAGLQGISCGESHPGLDVYHPEGH